MEYQKRPNNLSSDKRNFGIHSFEVVVLSCLLLLLLKLPAVDLIDLWIQRLLFDQTDTSWMISPNDRGLSYIIFYTSPKVIYVFLGVTSLFWLFRKWRKEGWQSQQSRLLLVVFVGVTVPLFVGWLKETTGVTCPDQESLFGGVSPHTSIWRNAIDGAYYYKLHCWPAGHASGGFGLMAIRLLGPTGLDGWVWIVPGMTLGWVTGLYQMARGQHFLSHTIVTMLIALLATSMAMIICRRYVTD